MIKRIFTVFVCFFCSCSFAASVQCPKAAPTSSANFCASFKVSATCHCTSTGLPQSMCSNMETLYNRMITIFGSLQKACAHQRSTSTQECIDDWNCYRLGGVDSKGASCSSTKKKCP